MSKKSTPTAPTAVSSKIDQNIPATDKWFHTQVKVVKSTYKWTIDNFSFCGQKTGESLKSHTFTTKSDDKWCIELYPRGVSADTENYLSIYLSLQSFNRNKVTAKFEFSILLNAERQKTKGNGSLTLHTFLPRSSKGFNRFIPRCLLLNGAKSILANDRLTIYCELHVVVDTVTSCSQLNTVRFKIPKRSLSDDYGSLLENEKLSDVIIWVNGGEFRAHKIVLAARSPVFLAMFEHKTNEAECNRVEITDISYNVMGEVLKFIYTGKTSKLEELAVDLLAAADKYLLETLKVMCEDALSKSLTVENVANILLIADLHNANQLKAHVIDFINKNATKVMDTVQWKSVIRKRPQLIAESYRALAMEINSPECSPYLSTSVSTTSAKSAK